MKNEKDEIQASSTASDEVESTRFFDDDDTECHICCSTLDEHGLCPIYKCWR